MGPNGLSRELICLRAAKDLREGMYVNLGIGLPTMVANFIPEAMEVVLHSQNGVLGYGRVLEDEKEWDLDLLNAGGQPVLLRKGACFFDSSTAFGMMRGGHLDMAILGAYQVSERGDLANWAPRPHQITGVGGAMDLCYGAKSVSVVMEHCTRQGKSKVVRECTLPLTARRVVDTIFTDLAVIKVSPQGLILQEVAPGLDPEEVQRLTEPHLLISPEIKEMEL